MTRNDPEHLLGPFLFLFFELVCLSSFPFWFFFFSFFQRSCCQHLVTGEQLENVALFSLSLSLSLRLEKIKDRCSISNETSNICITRWWGWMGCTNENIHPPRHFFPSSCFALIGHDHGIIVHLHAILHALLTHLFT